MKKEMKKLEKQGKPTGEQSEKVDALEVAATKTEAEKDAVDDNKAAAKVDVEVTENGVKVEVPKDGLVCG